MNLRIGTAEEVGMLSSRIDHLKDLAQQMVHKGITPAHVILAARKGVIVAHEAYGVSGPEPDAEPLALDALFPVCSITKVFTAACVLMLVEEGLIGLNRPVVDYIPEFTGEGKSAVRIHHLLTHTSGITYEELDKHFNTHYGKRQLPPCEPTQDPHEYEGLVMGYDVPLTYRPGTHMSYNGYGFDLLGEIIRRMTGISYVDFVQQRLFDPLGMNDTYFIVPESEKHRIVRRPDNAACGEWISKEGFLRSTSPGGGAIATVLDMAKFGQLFLNEGIYNGVRLLSPVTVREMVKNQIPGVPSSYRDEYFPEAYWGFGWAVNGNKRDGGDLFSPHAYSHWGAAGPFICVDPVYETVQVHFSVEMNLDKPFKNMYTDHINNCILSSIIAI